MPKDAITVRLSRRLDRIRAAGVRRSVRAAVDRSVLTVLQWRYGFAPWHAASPTSIRNYRVGVAAMVASLPLDTVVDVGCGLGAVLARIAAPRRHGYDTDAGAIRAARFLHGRAARFSVGSFADVVETEIDLLLALNWPHDLAPVEMEALVVPMLSRTRYLLLDKVHPSSPLPYRHYHNFAFLDGRADVVATDPCGEAHRSFLLYKVRR
jgi:SAM-dependent methyltransferase